ncbi:MAG: hypothetical protein AAGM22_07910 [Acidobacteriota bacterium]
MTGGDAGATDAASVARRALTSALLVGGTLTAIFFHVRIYSDFLIDDAFIFLSFARTLHVDGTWGFYPGLEANTATSPLTVLLMAAAMSLAEGATAAVLLDTVAQAASAFFLVGLSRRLTGSILAGVLAAAAMLVNPLLISSFGMETPLFGALYFASLYAASHGRWATSAAASGLLTLARPDGGLLFVLFVLQIPTWRERLRCGGIFVAVVAPWHLFSWVQLGSFLPESFFLKTGGAWGPWTFANGPGVYFDRMPLESALRLIFAPLLLAAQSLRRLPHRRVVVTASLFATGHAAVYATLGVPPYHWYYAPQIYSMLLVGALGLAQLRPRNYGSFQGRLWLIAVGVALLAPGLGLLEIHRRAEPALREMPLHSNWTTAETYREIAEWLDARSDGQALGLVTGEIGALSFYTDGPILDYFSDRRMTAPLLPSVGDSPEWQRALLLINFAFRSDDNRYPMIRHFLVGDAADPSAAQRGRLIHRWQLGGRWEKEAWLSLYAVTADVPGWAETPSPEHEIRP